jgi:membrane fusion protein (multidrug efflux system)
LLPPDNATGNFTKVVQRVPVKIVLDPHASLGTLVRPGMSVEATIETRAGSADAPTAGATEKASGGPAMPAPGSSR